LRLKISRCRVRPAARPTVARIVLKKDLTSLSSADGMA